MRLIFRFALLGAFGLSPVMSAGAAGIRVKVDQPGVAVSPMLWGIFFEDINLSLDGGVYAELLRNRSFEDSDRLDSWSLVTGGGAVGQMDVTCENPMAENPLRTHNQRSLCLRVGEVPSGGSVGVANEGYWGVPVKTGALYELRFGARCGDGFSGPLTATLESKDGSVYAKETVGDLEKGWKQFHITLKSSGTDPQARLVLSAGHKGTVWLDMVSLFPQKTWKGRPGGLRPDLMEMLVDLKPAFVRFPGGCWVEGNTMSEAYQWKDTVGNIAERRTQWNIWGYWATHGVGYHEYLQMCEDLGAEPLFVVNCGMSHHGNVPMDRLAPYVQDALDAIEYANGPADSLWGGLRAKNGHPAPFHLKYVEIGNENGGPAYQERYPVFHKALQDRYPDMNLITDVWEGLPQNTPVKIIDEHFYSTPDAFIQQAGKYDGYDRNGPKVYVGEYAVTENGGKGNMRAAVGEAAFMTGMERNSDVVKMSSYAPLFVHVNHRKWNPDLINFDNSRAYGIPSYYVQQMFFRNRGDVVLPVTVDDGAGEASPAGGAVGVGTWLTSAEFRDLKVTSGGKTLYAGDLASGMGAFRQQGDGQWSVEDGVLRQTKSSENVRAYIGDKSWGNYTYSLKARKLDGSEGFLIPFAVTDENAKCWWNLGGFSNSRHCVEIGGSSVAEAGGSIETGRWYDIRIELQGRSVRCFLDGKLIHDFKLPETRPLYASATCDNASGELILKVINTGAVALDVDIALDGAKTRAKSARVTQLSSADPTDENSLDEPKKVAPVTKVVALGDTPFRQTFPGNSVTVLRVK